jgi:tRNA modification GTPase
MVRVRPEASSPTETIVAIATPPGRGGIGVVRIAGPDAVAIAAPMLRLQYALAPRVARFGEVLDVESGQRLDEAVVTWFEAPHSYTGDHVVEIAAHGAPVLLEYLLRQAIARGARMARPGEFTERAFLAGRLDLTQAEAVRDLIEAQTLYQARVAAEQLHGALSRRVQPIKSALVDLIALLEAGIDFAEDDIDVLPDAEILLRLARVEEPLGALADSFAFGRIVHHGFTLAIVGPPNAGKSSLFNRLIDRDRAIVTATPGTTRDLVSERVAIGGLPIELIDTAGLRESVDEAESIGIRKSREALAEADLVLIVLDASETLTDEDLALVGQVASGRAIVVMNKIDLIADEESPTEVSPARRVARTSALNGDGVVELRTQIAALVREGSGAQNESGMVTNVRQHQEVLASRAALERVHTGIGEHVPHEMLLLDLYAGLRPLDALTGDTTADDILNLIFSSFCIGK